METVFGIVKTWLLPPICMSLDNLEHEYGVHLGKQMTLGVSTLFLLTPYMIWSSTNQLKMEMLYQ